MAAEAELDKLHLNRAIALGKLGRIKDALLDVENAILLRPDYVKAHYRMGELLLQCDPPRPQDAVAAYSKARELNGMDTKVCR